MFTKILQGIKNRNGILLLRTFRKHDIKEKKCLQKGIWFGIKPDRSITQISSFL